MASTTGGALKAYIESLGLGLSAYRDTIPEEATKPYVQIHEGIAISPESSGDFGDMNASIEVREEVQLDLYQAHRNDAGAIVESYTLPDALARKLRGAHLATAPKHVYGVRVLSGPNRFPDDDENVVRHLYTLALARAL